MQHFCSGVGQIQPFLSRALLVALSGSPWLLAGDIEHMFLGTSGSSGSSSGSSGTGARQVGHSLEGHHLALFISDFRDEPRGHKFLADREGDFVSVATEVIELRGFQFVMGDRVKSLPLTATLHQRQASLACSFAGPRRGRRRDAAELVASLIDVEKLR